MQEVIEILTNGKTDFVNEEEKIVAMLKNDFLATVLMFSEKEKNMFQPKYTLKPELSGLLQAISFVPTSYYDDIVKEIMKQSNLITDYNLDPRLLEFFPSILLDVFGDYEFESVLCDTEQTENILNSYIFNLKLTEDQMKKMLSNNYFAEKYPDRFCEYLKNFNISAEEKIKIIKKSSLEFNGLTKDVLLQEGILEHILGNKKDCDFIRSEINNKPYSPANEERLLKMLNTKEETLENYLISIQYKTRPQMSVLEVFALEYYTKKLLKNNTTTYDGLSVNAFNYHPSWGGVFNSVKNKIEIYNTKSDVRELIRVIHHEVAHACQAEKIRNQNVYEALDEDENIDIYCKDEILASILSEDFYYKENYRNFSYEFDADFRAWTMDAAFFGEEKEFDSKVDKLYMKQEREGVEKAKNNTDYIWETKRVLDGITYSQNDLFIKCINQKSYKLVEEFYKEYPILKYDMDFNFDEEQKRFSVKERSVESLIKNMITAKTDGEEKEAKIYLKLLVKRCDPLQVGENKSKENIQELKSVCEDLGEEDLIGLVKEELKQRQGVPNMSYVYVKKA